VQKPYELSDEAWAHFIMANLGRTEDEMQHTLDAIMLNIAEAEMAFYISLGGQLHRGLFTVARFAHRGWLRRRGSPSIMVSGMNISCFIHQAAPE